MYQVIIVIHVLLGLGVIGLVLMQQGKGADAGAAFGTGSAGSVFGAQGAASFLSRSTAILATLFFATSLGLAIANGHKGTEKDLMSTPATEQNNLGLPTVQGAKTETQPPVAMPIPETQSTVAPEQPPISQPAITPATTTNEKTESPVSLPKAVETQPSPTKETAKPIEEKKSAEQNKPIKEAKPAEVKKPVEHKPVVAKDKDKKAATTHKGKDVKKDH
jgi:preprotein translocase subunit SecG